MPIGAHFDGRAFVPDGPIDLPVGQRVSVLVEPSGEADVSGLPPDAAAFCARHGLVESVAVLRRLARERMTGLVDTAVRLETDPDSGESWITVEARLTEAAPTVLADYDALLRQWIATTEPRVRDQMCFTFAPA